MRYVTHQFTHVETLERARQWLVRAGIDPGRIVAHTNGVLSLAVAVEAGQAAEVQCVIDVAESSDPDGHPSFWELASQRHAYRRADAAAGTALRSPSFVVGWHPQDADREVSRTDTGALLLKEYQEDRD